MVFDVPHLRYPVPHTLLIAHRRGISDGFLAITHEEALAPVRQMEDDVRELAQKGLLRFADPKSVLCPGSACLYKVDGQSLYSDADHLSPAGAAYSAPALESCFDEPAARVRRGKAVNPSEVCQGVPAMPKYSTPPAGHDVAKSLAGKAVRGRYEPRLSQPLSSGSFRRFVCGFGRGVPQV